MRTKEQKNKRTTVVFGTFDGLHSGHLYFFKQARKLGDKLIVVVAPDFVVKKLKNKTPKLNEKERRELVASLRIIDKAVIGDREISSYKVVRRLRPDVICAGYDQKALVADLRKHFLKTKIVIAKAYKRRVMHSSSLITYDL